MPASTSLDVHRPWGRSGPPVEFAADISAADRAEIADVLARWNQALFGPHPVRVSVLVGGANNRNFIVSGRDFKYALRIATQLADRLAVDRASAIRAQADAAAGDLAPAVIAYVLPEGHVLSEFLEGEILDEDQLADDEVLRLAGRALKRLHRLESRIRRFSPFSDIRKWVDLARADGTALPDSYDELLEWVWRIEAGLCDAKVRIAFCHNDTVPQNFIRSGDNLRLVDWDYAGLGPVAFELASFCATAGLDREKEDVVLGAYAETVIDPAQRAQIELLRYVALMREVAWVVMATPILKGMTTPTEADFYERYLKTHLEMAHATVAAGTLESALQRAAAGAKAW